MLVPIVAAVVGLAVVLVAVYADAGLPRPSGPVTSWSEPPDPGRLAEVDFPVRARGYDIQAVERHLAELHAAYAALWRESGRAERQPGTVVQRGAANAPAAEAESQEEARA